MWAFMNVFGSFERIKEASKRYIRKLGESDAREHLENVWVYVWPFDCIDFLRAYLHFHVWPQNGVYMRVRE